MAYIVARNIIDTKIITAFMKSVTYTRALISQYQAPESLNWSVKVQYCGR